MKYITYSGHHNQFNCMLAQVANAHTNIGLFKEKITSTTDYPLKKCGLGENEDLNATRR